MWRACSKCGRVHSTKFKCTAGLKINSTAQERKLRSSYVWTEKSKEIREKANYLCEYCRSKGLISYENVEVHHIEKVRDQPEKFLDDLNLICLCVEHHKMADAGELSADQLRRIAYDREAK